MDVNRVQAVPTVVAVMVIGLEILVNALMELMKMVIKEGALIAMGIALIALDQEIALVAEKDDPVFLNVIVLMDILQMMIM